MYQFSFVSSMIAEICPEQAFYQNNLKKRSYSVNTGNTVTVLTLCDFPYDRLLVYKVSLNNFLYFCRYSPNKSVADGQSGDYRLFLRGA